MKSTRHPPIPPRFLLARPAHFIALGFGSGLAKIAPGTWGSCLAWPIYALMQPFLSNTAMAAFVLLAFIVGVWACDKTGKALGVSDHGGMVWDEMVAVWLLFMVATLVAPQSLSLIGKLLQGGILVGLFRVFDITKPWPIGWLDRRIKGGLGVMVDDILAAGFAGLLAWGLYLGWQAW